MSFEIFLVLLAVVCEFIMLLGLAVSKINTEERIWPPGEAFTWQYWLTWLPTIIIVISILTLVVLDWNNYIFSFNLRTLVGLPLIFIGFAIALNANLELSFETSSGVKGELVTGGIYQYSRHPQYLGDILLFLGLIIFSNSLLVLYSSAGLLVWFLFAPIVEEIWLIDQYGQDYREYRKSTFMFLDVRKIFST